MPLALVAGLIGMPTSGEDKPETSHTAEKLGYFMLSCFSDESGADAAFNDLKVSLPTDAEFREYAKKKGGLLRNGAIILTPPENQCAEGFQFTFTITPLWRGNDAKSHPIISFECVREDGEKYWLSLTKWPSGLLHFAVTDPKRKRSVFSYSPLLWVENDSHNIAGGIDANGLFISIDGAPRIYNRDTCRTMKSDSVMPVLKIERIVLGVDSQNPGKSCADFWLHDLYIGNSEPCGVTTSAVDPQWRIAPIPDWVVSPDVPMNCAGNLQRYAKNLKGQDVFIVVECPEGIVPGELMTLHFGGQTARISYGSKLVPRDGKNYYRWRYQLPPYALVCPELEGVVNKPLMFNLCLSTDLPYGTETDVHLGIEWEGGAQPPVRIPIHVSKMEPPPILKRLFVGMSIEKPDLATQGDYTAFAKRIGLNYIDIFLSDDWTPSISSPGVNPSADEVIRRCKDAGILPCFSIQSPTLLRYDVLPEGQRRDIDGKLSGRGGRCPSDRGADYRKDMDNCRNAAKRGIGLTFDLECNGFAKSQGCFCERCIDNFKIYLNTCHPDVAFVSPCEFEREPVKFVKLHKIWAEFISAQGSMWMYDLYKAAGEGLSMSRNKPHNPLFLIYDEGLWDSGIDLSEAFAGSRNFLRFFAGPPLYHDPEDSGKVLRKYIARHPKITDVMPYVGFCHDTPVNDMRSQVLEIFGRGAHGINFWCYPLIDGGELCKIVEGLNAVAKVEDILADGRPIPGVRAQPYEANVAISGGVIGPVVLLVSWYEPMVKPVTVTLPFPVTGNIVDLLTDETVIKLDAPTAVLTFPKIEGGARLYRCERIITKNNNNE